MRVCRRCLMAIESHEGYQMHKKIIVEDPDDEQESTCEWCEEPGFDILFEI